MCTATVAASMINRYVSLAIGHSLSYPLVILIGVTFMSRTFYTITLVHQRPSTAGFLMPATVRTAARGDNTNALAGRGAG